MLRIKSVHERIKRIKMTEQIKGENIDHDGG